MIRFPRYFVACGVLLSVALTLLDPDSSQGLPLPTRLAYWGAHVSSACVLLGLVQWFLRPGRAGSRRAAIGVVVMSGILGGLLFVPVAAGLETVFRPDERQIDLVREASEVLPQVLTFWVLINLPFLAGLSAARRPMRESEEVTLTTSMRRDELPHFEAPVEDTADQNRPSPPEPLTALLPAALGNRIGAISSELHYLRIYTDRGHGLVLGSLRGALGSDQLPPGLQIHRAHWVADDSVEALKRRGNGYVCVLTTGVELPVSRRRARQARERFG